MADDKNEEVAAPVEEDTKEEDKPTTEEKETPKSSMFGKLCGCFSKKPATESKEVPAEDKAAEPTEKADEQEKPEQAQPVTAE